MPKEYASAACAKGDGAHPCPIQCLQNEASSGDGRLVEQIEILNTAYVGNVLSKNWHGEPEKPTRRHCLCAEQREIGAGLLSLSIGARCGGFDDGVPRWFGRSR